jgi:hypothetical protein
MFRTAFKGQKISTKNASENASRNEFPRKKTSLGKEMRISFPREEKMRISFPREVFFLTFFGRFLHEKGGSGRAMCF